MKKILIIEDELAYSELLYSRLIKKGYKIIKAADGEKGLAIAKTENPDLILLDIIMPVMDGMTMLNMLRKEVTGRRTKVIVLTNLEPDDKTIKQIIKTQPSYYFIKSDIKFDDLLEKIGEVLAW